MFRCSSCCCMSCEDETFGDVYFKSVFGRDESRVYLMDCFSLWVPALSVYI